MNEELQKLLIELLKNGIEQTPAALNEYLNYCFINSVFTSLALGVVFIILTSMSVCCYLKQNPDNYRYDYNALSCVTGAFAAIFLIALVCQSWECVQIKYYPKAYLMNKIIHKTS